ncbi:MAG: hypothetical protein ACRERD_30870 [Candidatus Binatia bacterium]
MHTCYHCRHEIVIKDRVGRRDACPGCGAALRCCLNCSFYDTHYANACREPQADPVVDKAAANFCEFFAFRTRQAQQPSAATDARAKLEALFKKKS